MQFDDTWAQNPEINSPWLQNCGDVTRDGPCRMLCVPVFSSISSPGMMDLQNEVLAAFRQSDHSSASAPQVQSMWRKTSTTRAEASPSRDRRQNWEVPCWRAPLELLGTAPDVCGDCSSLDQLLGVWKDPCGVSICCLEMFGVFAIQSRWRRHSCD